jgi:hypothetical protein
MDTAHLLIVFFAAFTAMLAFGTVLLLCDALRKNNEHVRGVIGQLVNWKSTDVRAPKREEEHRGPESNPGVSPAPIARFGATQLETEPAQRVVDPAADGTLAYMHPKSATIANRPVAVRNEAVKAPVEVRQPIYIDTPVKDAAFTGVVVAIGLTEPDERLSQPIEELVRNVAKDSGIGSVMPDGFILAYPSHDRAAHRSVYELTEYLWRLQLQSLGASPALLAWGVVEVNGQPMPEAIESACERMREVRRIRKVLASQDGKHSPAIYTSILGRLLALRNSGKVRANYHPEITVLLDTESPDDETYPARGK